MIRKPSGRHGSIAKPIGVLAIVLLAMLSLAVFVYGDGRMALSTVSAQDVNEDALTKTYVDSAIEYYDDRGLGKTVERYGNPLSWDGERYLIVADAGTDVLVSSPLLYLNGRGVDALVPHGQLGKEIDSATEQGHWFDAEGLNMLTGQRERARYFVVIEDGLAFMSLRFSGNLSTPLPDPPAVTEPDDDALTMEYVERAWEYYQANGLEATVARYGEEDSIEGERYLIVVDPKDLTLLVSPIPLLNGTRIGIFAPSGDLASETVLAGEEGRWVEGLTRNMLTNQQEPARHFMALRDGLVFVSAHFIVRENVEVTTKEYVANAIARYERDGLDAAVEYYNSRESMDGQFYLFMTDENDIYLVHPIFPHLIGTDIKDIVGSDGQELGREIAQATEDGGWVEYLWPNPSTLNEERKVTWAIRHDGRIFASGYYTGREDPTPPTWVNANPREYTVEYVNRAIERYDRNGLESMKAYYNSVAGFDGEFYLFAMDENDIYIVHPLFPRLIGTDIKNVVGSDGYELGKEIAKATEEGHWIEYLWPHPITLVEAPKVAYAKRHDGYIFASGYYLLPDDPRVHTQEYVRKAIEMYDREGLEATATYYNSKESIDGQWYLTVLGKDDAVIIHGILPDFAGIGAEMLVLPNGFHLGKALLDATEEGHWFQFQVVTPQTSGESQRDVWVIRHDGLIFSSGYFSAE